MEDCIYFLLKNELFRGESMDKDVDMDYCESAHQEKSDFTISSQL